MTQEKLRRVVTAAVVAGTTLFVVLLSVLLYQVITIAVYNRRIAKIEQENADREKKIEELIEQKDYLENGKGMLWYAIEAGYYWKETKKEMEENFTNEQYGK